MRTSGRSPSPAGETSSERSSSTCVVPRCRPFTPGADQAPSKPSPTKRSSPSRTSGLFKELDERTHELTRSVGELKALGEVSQVVSSTLDLEAVLTRIVSHAVQLSGTDGGAIYEYDEPSEEFQLRATDHMEEELITALRANPPQLGDGVIGRAAVSAGTGRGPQYPRRTRLRACACVSCWSASAFAPVWLFPCCAKTASSAAWWYGENPPASFAPK